MIKQIIILWSSLFLLTACLPGTEEKKDNGLSVSSLEGVWYGVYADANSYLHTLEISMNSKGDIYSLLIDGVSTHDTGKVKKEGKYNFSYALSDSSVGGFLADSAGQHMGFLAEDYSYGVLQKGATGLPTFSATDITSAWKGYTVEVDYNLAVVKSYSSDVSISTNGDFSGSQNNSTFSGNLYEFSTTHGYWAGGWSDDEGNSGNAVVWLSADKTFAASWGCLSGYASDYDIYDAEYCSFSMWNRQ